MARADLIMNLVKAAARGDLAQFKKTVEALAADERAKNHTVFADKLLAHLHVDGNGLSRTVSPATRMLSGPFVVEVVPRRHIEDLILPVEAEQAVRELVEEQHRADLLRSYNLEPRNRVLLIGPPGNGKTSLAEGIADALSVPLLVVRYEAVIGSYLGETAQRLGQVFDYARTRHCVLFFDEFDAVGKERGDLHETGEIKRVVSSLLLQIDALPSYVVVVVASNHPELLDRAVWRRFQIRLELPMPTQQQIEEWFKRFEKSTGHKLGLTPRHLAEKLMGLNFAEIEELGADIVRRITLSEPDADTKKIAQQVLSQWMKRATVKTNNTGKGD
jgi:SpoVK/Ycf46/Vps4 family AAA+-type ATPase